MKKQSIVGHLFTEWLKKRGVFVSLQATNTTVYFSCGLKKKEKKLCSEYDHTLRYKMMYHKASVPYSKQ